MHISLRRLRKAVFLDRDGTLIRFVDLLHNVKDLRLLPRTGEALAKLRQLGYLLVLVTNQPVIARGMATEEMIADIHTVLQERLRPYGAELDALYVCPHHPNANVERYRVKCDCRKPEIGLILQAARDHSIDLSKSFMIGDSTRDTLAGNRAKLTTILVQTGEAGKDVWQFPGKPDHVATDLPSAVRYIKKHSRL
ncbi:MAG: HAD family hydrolase [Candidatus Taylorbacteria bacterium]|nr:HAD family hydrolase [Candidatus Taylorbacteria bacterium]